MHHKTIYFRSKTFFLKHAKNVSNSCRAVDVVVAVDVDVVVEFVFVVVDGVVID